jgi:hypothetical protein
MMADIGVIGPSRFGVCDYPAGSGAMALRLNPQLIRKKWLTPLSTSWPCQNGSGPVASPIPKNFISEASSSHIVKLHDFNTNSMFIVTKLFVDLAGQSSAPKHHE